MGINRFSDIEERKRNETDAKAGDELPKEKKGDPSSRLQASEGPAENPEKRRALEKLKRPTIIARPQLAREEARLPFCRTVSTW